MKRKYQTPTTTCVNIQLQQMIAVSTAGTTDTTEGNLSRELDFYSSEWEQLLSI